MVKQSDESRALPGKTLCTQSGFLAGIGVNIVITLAKQFLFPTFDLVFLVNGENIAHGCVSYIYPISIWKPPRALCWLPLPAVAKRAGQHWARMNCVHFLILIYAVGVDEALDLLHIRTLTHIHTPGSYSPSSWLDNITEEYVRSFRRIRKSVSLKVHFDFAGDMKHININLPILSGVWDTWENMSAL